MLRRPSRRKRLGFLTSGNIGLSTALHRHGSVESAQNNAFELIQEEIAIMKKINHPNVVSLIEVLDDPAEDSLYMVLEMCKKGVVMKIGLDEPADPYDEEQCRCWCRDMILGLEYREQIGPHICTLTALTDLSTCSRYTASRLEARQLSRNSR